MSWDAPAAILRLFATKPEVLIALSNLSLYPAESHISDYHRRKAVACTNSFTGLVSL